MSEHVPTYLAIARDIQVGIAKGIWKPGQVLPTRTELMRRFSVARATVDRAIEFLGQSGSLESRQGAGTYVREQARLWQVAVIGSPLPAQDLPVDTARITSYGYAQLANPSVRAALARCDGLLWNRPEENAVEWLRELAGRVPQVLINRAIEGFVCVSTDHRGAYRAITGERLDLLPASRPVFLRTAERQSLVTRYREAGFVDACRERNRFFEPLPMPSDFAEKLQALTSLTIIPNRPLLIVSDSLGHTGAVMHWARAQGVRWRQDVWYSDFDNKCEDFIWGVRVTSYIQEERLVQTTALTRLLTLIAGDVSADPLLVAPLRCEGET